MKEGKYYIKNTKLLQIANTERKCTIHTQSSSKETTSRRLRKTKTQTRRHRQASTGKLN